MEQGDKIIIAMVGLPARGKSYIARKLARYLHWAGLKAKVFNIGMYRRAHVGVDCNSTFFDQSNLEALKARENCAKEAIVDLSVFLNGKKTFKIYKNKIFTIYF
jgi:cytidylate kinase